MGEMVNISIRGLLAGEDAQTGDLETKVCAEYFKKGQAYYFFYEEQPDGFEQKCKSRIKYKDNVLELVRQGLIETRMVFEKDTQHMTRYVVPYGEVMLGIQASEVSLKETEERIQILVEYDLEMDGEHQAHSKIEINVMKS